MSVEVLFVLSEKILFDGNSLISFLPARLAIAQYSLEVSEGGLELEGRQFECGRR